MTEAKQTNRFKILDKIPLDRERPMEEERATKSFKYDVQEEDRIRRTRLWKGENYKKLEEMRGKTDDEFLEDLMNLINERDLLSRFERKIRTSIDRRYGASRIDPDEDWWGHGPHFETIVTDKDKRRFRLQRERYEAERKRKTEAGLIEPEKSSEELKKEARKNMNNFMNRLQVARPPRLLLQACKGECHQRTL